MGILFSFGNFTAAALQCVAVAFGGELGALTRARCRVGAVDGIVLGYYAYGSHRFGYPLVVRAFGAVSVT